MPIIVGKSKIKQATVTAVITRADGTVEDLGVIAEYKKPLRKRIVNFFKRNLKRFKKE